MNETERSESRGRGHRFRNSGTVAAAAGANLVFSKNRSLLICNVGSIFNMRQGRSSRAKEEATRIGWGGGLGGAG